MTYEQWETKLRMHLVNQNAIWTAASKPEMRILMLKYVWGDNRSPTWYANRLNARWNKRIQKLQELNR